MGVWESNELTTMKTLYLGILISGFRIVVDRQYAMLIFMTSLKGVGYAGHLQTFHSSFRVDTLSGMEESKGCRLA